MLKRFCVGLTIITLSHTALASAASSVNGGFFAGLGGSYDSISLENQTIYGKGVNKAYTGGVLTATGSAAGYSNPFYAYESLVTPHAQIGYFQHFKNSDSFWGVKMTYDYLNVTFSHPGMVIAQAGSNTNVLTGAVTSFTGNYAIETTETTLNNELLLLAFLGYSIGPTNLYFGVGPAVLQIQSHIYHLIGFADYKGTPGTDISGAPVNLSGNAWAWGGAVQLGMTYTFASSFFLDFNYTFTKIAKNTMKFISPFTNVITPDHLVGTSYINPSQQAGVQAFGVSLNKVFS